MASCTTSQWGNSYSPQVKLTVTTESSTNTSVTYSWKLQYIAELAASVSSARSYTAKIDGDTVKSGTYSINGKTGTSTIASGTKTISKGTSSRTVKISVSFAFELTWSGTYAGTKTASSSFSIGAKPKYTITYNANGGSGAPAAQTKYYGSTLSLSSVKPTRTGYSFLGWSTSSTATSASYTAGGSYTANASDTLYAVWKANTYAVSYNANGGSGAPAGQTKTYGKTLVLSTVKPTRTYYNFKGWATSATAVTASYAAGANYTANTALTLYAVWELAYVKPRITGLSVSRFTSDGTDGIVSDAGTYALVEFSWASDFAVSSINISWKAVSDVSFGNPFPVKAEGKIGSVSQVVGKGAISTDTSYIFEITVADSGGSTPETRTVASRFFVMDFKKGGKGVAIGKAAERDDLFEVALNAQFNKGLIVKIANATDSVNMAFDQETINLWKSIIGSEGILNLSSLLLNVAHPIGSIIQTTKTQEQFNPNTMLGGTWRLLSGVFLYGADSSREITSNTKDGGSTDAVVPHHRHYKAAISIGSSGGHNHTWTYTKDAASGTGKNRYANNGDNSGTLTFNSSGAHGHTVPAFYTDYAGTSGNEAGANMPPYKSVNIWERIA